MTCLGRPANQSGGTQPWERRQVSEFRPDCLRLPTTTIPACRNCSRSVGGTTLSTVFRAKERARLRRLHAVEKQTVRRSIMAVDRSTAKWHCRLSTVLRSKVYNSTQNGRLPTATGSAVRSSPHREAYASVEKALGVKQCYSSDNIQMKGLRPGCGVQQRRTTTERDRRATYDSY